MFTHRFFSAIGRANHQAAVEAARYASSQGPDVVYPWEALLAEEPIQASSNPTLDVPSPVPPSSLGAAPPVQSPPPAADLPPLERTAEPTPEPTAEQKPEVQEGLDYAFAQGLLLLTNEARIANGLAPLNEHPALVAAAQKYAETHTRLSPLQLSHQVDGSTLSARMEGEGYVGWTRLGENLHLNPLDAFRTVEQTFQDWMTGAHRDNILDPNFQDIGIACYVGMAEPYPVQICVQDFGARY